jgi:hypothetical protein
MEPSNQFFSNWNSIYTHKLLSQIPKSLQILYDIAVHYWQIDFQQLCDLQETIFYPPADNFDLNFNAEWKTFFEKSVQWFGMYQLLIDYIVINSYCNFMHDMRSKGTSDYDSIVENQNKLQLPFFQQMLNDCWQLGGDTPPLQDFAWYFAEFLGQHPALIDIFCQCSVNNAQLKTLCTPGAALLDHIYSNVHILYGRASPDIKFIATPNDALRELYDLIAAEIHNQGLMPKDKDVNTLIGRHWNNKGNSMECLSIYIWENGKDYLLWSYAKIMSDLTVDKPRQQWSPV